MLFNRDGDITAPVPVVGSEVYPVGAGDACSAGLLIALALGCDDRMAVDLANRMGAWVASHVSATPPISQEIVDYLREELCSGASF